MFFRLVFYLNSLFDYVSPRVKPETLIKLKEFYALVIVSLLFLVTTPLSLLFGIFYPISHQFVDNPDTKSLRKKIRVSKGPVWYSNFVESLPCIIRGVRRKDKKGYVSPPLLGFSEGERVRLLFLKLSALNQHLMLRRFLLMFVVSALWYLISSLVWLPIYYLFLISYGFSTVRYAVNPSRREMVPLCTSPYEYIPTRLRKRWTHYFLDEEGNSDLDNAYFKGLPLFSYVSFLADPSHKAFALVYVVLKFVTRERSLVKTSWITHLPLLPFYGIFLLFAPIPLRVLFSAYRHASALLETRSSAIRLLFSSPSTFWSLQAQIVQEGFLATTVYRIYKTSDARWNFNPKQAEVPFKYMLIFKSSVSFANTESAGGTSILGMRVGMLRKLGIYGVHAGYAASPGEGGITFSQHMTRENSDFGSTVGDSWVLRVESVGSEKPRVPSIQTPLAAHPRDDVSIEYLNPSTKFMQLYAQKVGATCCFYSSVLLNRPINIPGYEEPVLIQEYLGENCEELMDGLSDGILRPDFQGYFRDEGFQEPEKFAGFVTQASKFCCDPSAVYSSFDFGNDDL